jgi:hypothetical protein
MAKIVAAFPNVQIAVTDTGRLHLDQDLRSRRLRRRLIDFLQGGIEIRYLETLHRFSPDLVFLAGWLRSQTGFLDRPETHVPARLETGARSENAANGALARLLGQQRSANGDFPASVAI